MSSQMQQKPPAMTTHNLITYLLTYSLTHSLTHSKEQNSSWEANRFSASQEIPRILWKPKVHYRIYKSLSWARSIQSMPPHSICWRSSLILFSRLRLGLPSGLFLSGFPTKTLYEPLLSSLPYVLHAPPISFSIWSPEQYWVRSTDQYRDNKFTFHIPICRRILTETCCYL